MNSIQKPSTGFSGSSAMKNRPLSAISFQGIYSKKPKEQKMDIDHFMNNQMGPLLINADSMSESNSGDHEYDRQERHNVYNEILKKRPTFTKVDKEKLYEESVLLNRKLEELRKEQENLLLELQDVENEKLKYQKLISDVETYVDSKKGQKISLKESWLVINLKKQLQSLHKEIADKQATIINLKRSPFATLKQEHDISVQIFQEYSDKFRLKAKHLKATQSQKNLNSQQNESQDHSFGSMKSSLQYKVVEMESEQQVLQQQNEELESTQKITERKVAHTLVQLNQVKEELKEKESELEFLKEKIMKAIEREKKNKEIDSKVNSFKNRNKVKEDEEEKIRKNSEKEKEKDPNYQALKIREEVIVANQKKIAPLKQQLQEITSYEIKSKNELTEEVNRLKQVFQTLQNRHEELQNESEDQQNKTEKDTFPNFGEGFTINNNVLQKQVDKIQIKVPKVSSSDIKIIAFEVKLRLSLKGISITEAVKKLFSPELSLSNGVTIDYMRMRLQMSPYSIKSDEDALLFSRFLIEDNQEDYLALDFNRTNNYRVIRSIFKNSVGAIKIKSEEEEMALWKSISLKIRQFESGLKQQFDLYEKTDFVSSDLVVRCLEETLNEVTREEQEYVLMRMFEATNDYLHLKKDLLFQVFSQNEWQSREQRRAKYQIYLEEGKAIEDHIEHFPTEQNSFSSSNLLENELSPKDQSSIQNLQISSIIKKA